MTIGTLYYTVCNFAMLVVGLIAIGMSIYLEVEKMSTFSHGVLAFSLAYLLIPIYGIMTHRWKRGYIVFIGLLGLLAVFQTLCFLGLMAFRDGILEYIKTIDGGDVDSVHKGYEFMQETKWVWETTMIVGVFAYIIQILATIEIRRDAMIERIRAKYKTYVQKEPANGTGSRKVSPPLSV